MRAGEIFLFLSFASAAVAQPFYTDVTEPMANYFSTSNGNPGGILSYLGASALLPLTASWNGNGSIGCTVPAWAPSNSAGNFAPAIFQADSCVSAFFGIDPGDSLANVLVGDIVVRTSDDSNSHVTLLVTAPANFGPDPSNPQDARCSIDVASEVWNARLNAQPQDWILSINGVEVSTGVINGSVPRSNLNADNLSHSNSGGGTQVCAGGTVQLDIFKDPVSASGDFVGVQLVFNYIADTNTPSTAEIPIYNTTNVNQTATAYSTEIRARMQGGTYLYDQTFGAPYTDSSVQAAITAAKAVLTSHGALSLSGPTQLSSNQSTSASANTVQNITGAQVLSVTITSYYPPQTVVVGDHGYCQGVTPGTLTVPPVFVGCTGGSLTPLSLFGGSTGAAGDSDTLTVYQVTIAQTVTTTTTTLTSQVYEIDGFTSPFSPCDVNQDNKTNVVDAQEMINEALGDAKPADDLDGDGVVNVVDIQIVMNAALNLGCSATTDTPATVPTITAVVNAASFRRGPIAPGEVVALVGAGLGHGEVQVLFDGAPAPVTYVSPTQIKCVVPYEVSSEGRSEIQIRYRDWASVPLALATAAANPAIFSADGSGSGPAAALNQDLSPNSPANPAAKGSTLVLFLTGEGQTSPPGVTGKVTSMSGRTPQPLLPVAVLVGGQPASVTSFGEAPGVISGVMQLHVQIPSNVPSGEVPISVAVGGNSSQSDVMVSVRE
jgi:uncharacterized protein (TIGR03437 family)